jgi:hypothetical protein
MSYTIVADVCEGIHDCIPVCPIEGAILDEWVPELQVPAAPRGHPPWA